MTFAEITSPKLFLTPSVLEPTIKSDVEAMGIKQTSQQKLVHARKELQMDDLESEPGKKNDATFESLHSNLKISKDSGPHQMKRKKMTTKRLKSHLKRTANLVVKSERVSKINSRGRRNLDHPIVRSLAKHQNCLFMKEH
jgi:hypothetical protein